MHTPAAGQYAVHRVFKQTPAEVWFFKPHLCRHFLASSLRTGVVFLRICQRLSSISVTKAAESIRAGDLSRRITGIATKDEVQELADTFNTMLERLERSFERERQFTSDASHELRTPVAVISACVEELEAGLSAGEAAQSLAAIRRESARMNKIISQLLMLTQRDVPLRYPTTALACNRKNWIIFLSGSTGPTRRGTVRASDLECQL